jgi:hypothetical protein
VATPVGAEVVDWLEAVRDAMVNLLRIIVLRVASLQLRFHSAKRACTHPDVRLGYALGDDLLVALLVARVLAVLALVPGRVEQEL